MSDRKSTFSRTNRILKTTKAVITCTLISYTIFQGLLQINSWSSWTKLYHKMFYDSLKYSNIEYNGAKVVILYHKIMYPNKISHRIIHMTSMWIQINPRPAGPEFPRFTFMWLIGFLIDPDLARQILMTVQQWCWCTLKINVNCEIIVNFLIPCTHLNFH